MKLGRGSRLDADGRRTTALIAVLATEHPASLTLDRLAHEYALKDELDAEWGHCHVNVGRTSASQKGRHARLTLCGGRMSPAARR